MGAVLSELGWFLNSLNQHLRTTSPPPNTYIYGILFRQSNTTQTHFSPLYQPSHTNRYIYMVATRHSTTSCNQPQETDGMRFNIPFRKARARSVFVTHGSHDCRSRDPHPANKKQLDILTAAFNWDPLTDQHMDLIQGQQSQQSQRRIGYMRGTSHLR